MPNVPIIPPKTFAVILLASVGHEVASFMIQVPEALLAEAQRRAINIAIQGTTLTIGGSVAGGPIDPLTPLEYFNKTVEGLANASSPTEAAARGTVAAGVFILSAASSEDPNTSLAFGAFLIVFLQNVIFPGSQSIFTQSLFTIYVIRTILIRIITEIRVEIKRRQLNLPRAKFKFNIFTNIRNIRKKRRNKDFVFKYLRFKKRKFKILSRNLSLPVPCQKELVIKKPVMVQP